MSAPPDPHPSDEQLSAAIDGMDPAALEHASSCDRCSYRLSAMQGVASMLAFAPPVDETARERALTRAVAAAVDAPGPARRPGARWTPILGVAALILAVLVAVPVLFMRGSDDDDSVTSTADDAALSADNATGAAEAASPEELGEFSDSQALRSALVPRVGEELIGAPSAALEDSSKSGSPTTTTVSPAGQASGGGRSSSFSAGSGASCVAQANRDYGDRVQALVYTGNLTWQGTPSVVLVYQVKEAQGPVDKLVLVLGRADCRLLTSLGL